MDAKVALIQALIPLGLLHVARVGPPCCQAHEIRPASVAWRDRSVGFDRDGWRVGRQGIERGLPSCRARSTCRWVELIGLLEAHLQFRLPGEREVQGYRGHRLHEQPSRRRIRGGIVRRRGDTGICAGLQGPAAERGKLGIQVRLSSVSPLIALDMVMATV